MGEHAGPPLEPLLWHYTDFGGLEGIIRKKTFRASEILYLNDSSEFKHYIDVAVRLAHEIGAPIESAKFAPPDWIVAAIRGHMMDYLNRAYVACFSRKLDDLNQWRGYTKAGLAFSIGFDRDALAAIKGELIDVEYRLDVQRTAIRHELDAAYAAARLDPALTEHLENPDLFRYFHNRYVKPACKILAEQALYNKDSAFKEEEEVRLIIRSWSIPDVKYRPSASLIVPYVDWTIPVIGEVGCPIRHVIVGPGPHMTQVMKVTCQIASGIGVSPSKVPYRNW